MAPSLFNLFLALCISYRTISGQVIDACTQINSCSCQNSKGVIDLSPLDGGSAAPRFKDVQSSDPGGNSFSWNPCTAFSEGGGCTGVAVCQIQEGFPRNYIPIGYAGNVQFLTNPVGTLKIEYSATYRGVLRTSHITLECDPSSDPGTFIAHGEDPILIGNYYMTYRGVHACAVNHSSNGLSAGSILCIILFVGVALYLCCGILYQTVIRKATGKEVIPQFAFWSTLPGLVTACQVQPGSPGAFFSIGTQDSATFIADNSGGLTLQYSADTDALRTSLITLKCDPDQDPGTFTAAGEDPNKQAFYDMTYTGKHACPSSGPGPGPNGESSGLSVGSILCIVFFVLVIVYVAGGIAFQIFIRKASGKEIVPQSGFWFSLPGLAKACQVQLGSPGSFFSIGTQDSATFIADNSGGLTLQYSADTDALRTSLVTLVCDTSQNPGTLTAKGEDPNKQAFYACQIQPGSPPAYFNIGTQPSAKFVTDQQSKVTLEYEATGETTRKAFVSLVCDAGQDPGTVTAKGEGPTAEYRLTYTGVHACPRGSGPSPSGNGSGSLSVGSILCIVVFSVLFVYLIAGILIQKFVRKASGKEIIPQYSIWAAGPGLVKDGVLLVVRRGKVGKAYDNI